MTFSTGDLVRITHISKNDYISDLEEYVNKIYEIDEIGELKKDAPNIALKGIDEGFYEEELELVFSV